MVIRVPTKAQIRVRNKQKVLEVSCCVFYECKTMLAGKYGMNFEGFDDNLINFKYYF